VYLPEGYKFPSSRIPMHMSFIFALVSLFNLQAELFVF